MKQVTVIFEHDEDGWWVASAAEIRGCHTQGRSIAQARQRFGEALGLFVDHPEKVVLVEDIRLPAAARRIVDASADARASAESVQRRAVESTRNAVETLTNELALSVRDVGELLGLSHQRVQQIVRARPSRSPMQGRRKKRSAASRK